MKGLNMPTILKPQTYQKLATAKPKTNAYRMGDGNGLFLCVLPSGKKRWQFDYTYNGKRTTYTFGYFESMDLKDAREAVCLMKGSLLKGIPPKKQDNIPTFAEVVEEWLSMQQWVVGHRKRIASFFDREVLPHIGDMPIHEIQGGDIMKIATNLVAENKRNSAKDVIQRCTAVFEHAIDMGWCSKNPARNKGKSIKRNPEQRRPSLAEDQIPDFLKNMDNYQGREFIKIGLNLLMLTFVRPSELRCATWDEFNFERKEWFIPKERMKKRRNHIVPLSQQVIDLLYRLKEVNRGSEYLFPSIRSAYKPISDVTFLKALQIMGYVGNKKIVPHGFRHTASTILHNNDFNSLHIEMQLSHIDKNEIRGTYNDADYMPQRIIMMQWYADYIAALK
jgi:integrase